ncbi:hypothetical protein D3C80_2092320 [compost metagenome]
MLLMGLLLMLRSGAEDIVRYMESQIGVKVYVEQGLDVQEVAYSGRQRLCEIS